MVTEGQAMRCVLDAYEHALGSFRRVAEAVADDQWSLPTDCPGWTVRDQVAHVLALELQLSGEPLPARLATYGEHVRSPVGEHMESGVAALAGRSPAELVAELATVSARHVAQLRAGELDPEQTVVGILGNEVPLTRFLPVRVFDVWAHEQDVREATGRPGGFDGPAAEVSRGQVVGALPYLVGKQLAPPPGTSVAFDVTGPLPVATTVTVGEDGRGTAADGVDAGATAVVRTTSRTFLRLACGRIDPATAEAEVSGDRELGRRAMAALAMTP